MLSGANLWTDTQIKINKLTKDLPIKERSKINNSISKDVEKECKETSLGMVYDKNGFKRVEPTSSLVNWLQPKNTGYNIQIIRDDKKLIEAEPENQDKNLKSDFIPYGTIEGVERKDLKYDMPLENDFKAHNSPLYLEDMKKFKDDVFNDMVNRLVDKENTEIVKLYALK